MTLEFIAPTKRRGMTRARAARIFLDANGICCNCGTQIRQGDSWFVEHLTSLAQGGADDDKNARSAHTRCKAEKDATDAASKAKRDRLVTAGWDNGSKPKLQIRQARSLVNGPAVVVIVSPLESRLTMIKNQSIESIPAVDRHIHAAVLALAWAPSAIWIGAGCELDLVLADSEAAHDRHVLARASEPLLSAVGDGIAAAAELAAHVGVVQQKQHCPLRAAFGREQRVTPERRHHVTGRGEGIQERKRVHVLGVGQGQRQVIRPAHLPHERLVICEGVALAHTGTVAARQISSASITSATMPTGKSRMNCRHAARAISAIRAVISQVLRRVASAQFLDRDFRCVNAKLAKKRIALIA